MNWQEHVVSSPEIMMGKPVFRNTRIPVDLILDKLAHGETNNELLEAYPSITKEDIYAALSFASETIKNERVYSVAS